VGTIGAIPSAVKTLSDIIPCILRCVTMVDADNDPELAGVLSMLLPMMISCVSCKMSK
jgi:hypothetical protein